MIELRQTETFRRWRTRLKDERARAMIASRLDRLAFGNPGDVKPVGQGVSELRIDYGRDWQPSGGNRMPKKIAPRRPTNYDPAEDLGSEEAIAVFMDEAFKTNDVAYISHALGVVARAKGMAQIASQTGLSREQLYRSFSARGNPTLKATLAVMKALRIQLTTKADAA